MKAPRFLAGARRATLGAFCAAILAVIGLRPSAAQACGGFFCSIANPIDQAGERILFAVEGTTVTAIIQIMYQGSAEKFSWVLPLPSQPKLDVSNDIVFNRLHQVTDPRFQIEWKNDPGCNFQNDCWAFDEDFDGRPQAGRAGGEGKSGVEILDEGQVGPFDFKVLGAVDGSILFQWLKDNGYDQPPEAAAIVSRYVDEKYVFVALKLQKDKEAGDIQPVVVVYDAPDLACVPIRLTAVAAAPDMPVYSWILGDARAVPMNFFNVVLNPKAFDFLNCGNGYGGGFRGGFGGWNPSGVDCQKSYLDVVTAAANSANGHGFVTEYAGSADIMKNMIYNEGRYDLEKLAAITSPAEFLREMLRQGFPRMALTQEIIRDWIPKPSEDQLPEDCKSDPQFYNWNTEVCVQYIGGDWVFDPASFAADLKERLLDPLEETQSLFDKHPYLTRLFTTLSAEEMTKDPLFAFNSDVPDVSNQHGVTAKSNCNAKGTLESVTLTYEDGTSQTLKGTYKACQWVPDPEQPPVVQPPVKEIQILTETGLPTLVGGDEVAAKDEELDAKFPELSGTTPRPTQPTQPTTPGVKPTPTGKSGGSTGCSAGAAGGPTGLGLVLFGLVFGLGLSRRRRSATQSG